MIQKFSSKPIIKYGSQYVIHFAKTVFFFNQVHLNGSEFVIHYNKTIFFFYQVHKNGPQIMIHCCNIVVYSKQLHKYGSWIVIHFYETYGPLRIRLQVWITQSDPYLWTWSIESFRQMG